MESNTTNIRWVIVSVILLLSLYATVSISRSGETIKIIQGEVKKCNLLGGGKEESIPHATIKTEMGSYLISSLKGCNPGEKVNVFIKRGALYFNTIYVAEKA